MTTNEAMLIKRMNEHELRMVLLDVIQILDEADDEDIFGTEGWRYLYGFEIGEYLDDEE